MISHRRVEVFYQYTVCVYTCVSLVTIRHSEGISAKFYSEFTLHFCHLLGRQKFAKNGNEMLMNIQLF